MWWVRGDVKGVVGEPEVMSSVWWVRDNVKGVVGEG